MRSSRIRITKNVAKPLRFCDIFLNYINTDITTPEIFLLKLLYKINSRENPHYYYSLIVKSVVKTNAKIAFQWENLGSAEFSGGREVMSEYRVIFAQ